MQILVRIEIFGSENKIILFVISKNLSVEIGITEVRAPANQTRVGSKPAFKVLNLLFFPSFGYFMKSSHTELYLYLKISAGNYKNLTGANWVKKC